MSRKIIFKIISLALVQITFFYPSLLVAGQQQDKLAARSRFQRYFSSEKNKDLLPAEQFPASMPVFTNAMSTLNRVMLDPTKTEQDIVAAINEQNVALKDIRVVIDNNVYYRNIGARRVPYLVLAFGQQGQMRDLFFFRDYNEWSDEDLVEIGVRTQEDKDYLRIPGVAGSWLTKHEEIIRGLAAGEEAVSLEEQILDLMVADIANMLTSGERRDVLRWISDLDRQVVYGVPDKIAKRIKEIETAIRMEMFNLVKVWVTASLRGILRCNVKREGEEDYFARPSTELCRGYRSVAPTQTNAIPIYGAPRFKALLDKLVERALQTNVSLLGQFIRELNARYKDTTDGMTMEVSQSSIDSVIRTIFSETGLGRFFESGTRLGELVIKKIPNLLLINPDVTTDGLSQKKQAMLEKIKTKAGEFEFTDIQVIPTQPDNAERIMEVPFVKKYDVRLNRMVWRLIARNRLNVFDHTLSRLVVLQEALGEEFTDSFIRNILVVERARTEFASDFFDDPVNAEFGDKKAFRDAAVFSYLAMAKADERFTGTLNLKGNWPAIVGQYFWVEHIYGNPDFDMAKAVTMNQEEFSKLVRRRIEVIVLSTPPDLINRTLKKYFDIELPEDTNLVDLISRIVPAVWEVHIRFVDALQRKADEYIGVVAERGLAAGEEGGEGKRPTVWLKDSGREVRDFARNLDEGLRRALRRDAVLQEIKPTDHIVIDCKQWELLLTYVRNPETGKIEEKDRVALSRLNPPLGFIGLFQEHKLQLVFTSVVNYDWVETMVRAKRVIEDNLEAVKVPNSIVRGEDVILMVDADGIIYVMPETGASTDVLSSLRQKVQATLALQSAVARSERAGQKGFIDLDARLFQIQNPDFQELLYNRLQEVYNEGLVVKVARVAGQIEEQIPHEKIRSILNRFDQRANSAEWSGVESTKVNTVTIVSSDNTQLASEREGTSTVIRLGFDLQLNLPQLSPAILIARAIISVGGEQNVTGSLLADIKNLYLNMVPQELQDQVQRATSISELLAIILPPISAADLYIYEYLLIGNKVAEIAA